MEVVVEFFHKVFSNDLEGLIKWGGGLMILIMIVYAETGLMVGFFLPGDSLLITAGLLASPSVQFLDIYALNVALIIAAIAGDNTGYWFGRKTGPKIFKKENSRFFKREYLLKAKDFYEKHGGKAIIYARFVPFARTFAPIVAGIARMNYRIYISFSIFGGMLWVMSMTLVGYFFGNIPFVKKNFEYVIVGIIVLSVLPIIIGYIKGRRESKYKVKELS